MKRFYIIASVAAIATIFYISSRDSLARLAWQNRAPKLALLLLKNDTELAMRIGNYYFGGNTYNPTQAKRAFEKALQNDQKILWGHFNLSRIYFLEGSYDRALEEINKELDANPENLRSLYVRGLIFGYRGNHEKAAEDFSRFIQWAPKEWGGYNDLAWALFKLSEYQEAKSVIQDAFREVPHALENPWLWNSLGVAELNLSNYEDAKRAFMQAKALAEKLDEREWRRAYPGNNPASARDGIREFLGTIEENLRRSGAVDKR